MSERPERKPPVGAWMETEDRDYRVALLVTYKGWDGEQHVWVAWVPLKAQVTNVGADVIPGFTAIEFRQPKEEWDATQVSEQNYMPFETACEGIRNMINEPDVELKFRFVTTFSIEVERVDGENLPNADTPKKLVAMPFPIARPGVKTRIGSM